VSHTSSMAVYAMALDFQVSFKYDLTLTPAGEERTCRPTKIV